MKTCKNFNIKLCDVCDLNGRYYSSNTFVCWITHYKIYTEHMTIVKDTIKFLKDLHPDFFIYFYKSLEVYNFEIYNKIQKFIPLL